MDPRLFSPSDPALIDFPVQVWILSLLLKKLTLSKKKQLPVIVHGTRFNQSQKNSPEPKG
jgi:hypothetical protein